MRCYFSTLEGSPHSLNTCRSKLRFWGKHPVAHCTSQPWLIASCNRIGRSEHHVVDGVRHRVPWRGVVVSGTQRVLLNLGPGWSAVASTINIMLAIAVIVLPSRLRRQMLSFACLLHLPLVLFAWGVTRW